MILDTNALSAFADGEPSIEGPLRTVEQILIPSIVLGEYNFGIIQSRKKREYESWLDSVVSVENVLCPDSETAKIYAKTRLKLKSKGRPIPYHDIWIAALAIQYRLPILSKDQHFDEIENITRIAW